MKKATLKEFAMTQLGLKYQAWVLTGCGSDIDNVRTVSKKLERIVTKRDTNS